MPVERGLVANARYSFPTMEQIIESKATVIRTIVYANDDLEGALQNVPRGVGVIALLNSEHEDVGQAYLGWETALPRFAQQFEGRVRAVEVTNEWDLLNIPASLVARLVKFATPILRDNGIKSVLGSVAGGNWKAALEEVAALLDPDDYDEGCFHPYGQKIIALGPPQPGFDPGMFFSVLQASARLGGKKICVSEFGFKISDYGGEGRQAECVRAAFNELDALPPSVCDCACLFAWRDDVGAPYEQGENAFGLIATDGRRRPSWDEFVAVAANGHIQEEDDPMADFVLGFKDVHDASPDIIGDALEDEYGFATGVSFQRTSNGLLFWANTADSGGEMGFIANDGTRYHWVNDALEEVAA